MTHLSYSARITVVKPYGTFLYAMKHKGYFKMTAWPKLLPVDKCCLLPDTLLLNCPKSNFYFISSLLCFDVESFLGG